MAEFFAAPPIAGLSDPSPPWRLLISTPTPRRVAPTLVAVLALTALLALTACGGGGGEEEPATTPAGETPTQAQTVEQPIATPGGPTPAAEASPTAAEIDASNSVTFEEVDEALGEFTTGGFCGPFYCQYDTESGIYLRIEQGSPQDFEAGAELIDYRFPGLAEAMQGVEGEPVPGVGDEAAWFDGEVAVLSVREDNAYFRIVLNLPEVDSSTQLDIAKGLATKAIQQLP